MITILQVCLLRIVQYCSVNLNNIFSCVIIVMESKTGSMAPHPET